MAGLWEETLDNCEAKIRLARSVRRDGDLDRARRLVREAREEIEVVRGWASMTRLIEEAQRRAREIQ